MKSAVNVMFTEIQATLGVNLFGERAVVVVIKELKKLEEGPMPGKKAVTAIDPDVLSTEYKAKSLNSGNLTKQTRDVKIKGRTRADGIKYKRYLGKDGSVTSPNVSLESLFTVLVIDADEEHDIANFNISGAYLHADIPADKNVIMKLRRSL